MKRYYIEGLQGVDKIYFGTDGINFSERNSVQLHSYSHNEFNADPEEYVIFHSDLNDPGEKISDDSDSITFADSAYHTIIVLDGKEYAVDDDEIKKVKDVFCEVRQDEWITAAEATRQWNLGESTIRSAIRRRQFEEDEFKKLGRDWFVKVSAMERLYGEPKQ